jgi:hypothetical protein
MSKISVNICLGLKPFGGPNEPFPYRRISRRSLRCDEAMFWLQVKRDCTFQRPIKLTNDCTRFALEDIQAYEKIKKGSASMLCPEGKPLTAGGVQ